MYNTVIKLVEELKIIQGKIQVIQDNCAHSNVKKVAKSDTGNWDKSQDSYWFECSCPDCGKYWTEPQ